MNYRALAIGAAIGFLFALAPSCGNGAKKCDVTNCNGCCAADGTCTLTANQTAAACGASGLACTACAAGQTCTAGVCGGGGAGGGGGGSCASQGKCTKTNGQCGEPCTNGCCANDAFGTCVTTPSLQLCGANGATCQACTGSQTCQATTGGSACTTPGAPDSGVGNTCASSADCANWGLSCKTSTGTLTDGGARGALVDGGTYTAVYQDGFCTKTCSSNAQCGAGNSCIQFGAGGGISGEIQSLCVPNCNIPDLTAQNPTLPCRAGYACMPTANNTAGSPGFCWVDAPQTNVGGPCTTAEECGDSFHSACYTPEFPDGGGLFANGYCTADCAQSQDNTFCGTNAICVGFNDGSGSCVEKCGNPDGGNMTNGQASETPGQSTCRDGYRCVGGFNNATLGACGPACTNAVTDPCNNSNTIPYHCQTDPAGPAYGYCCPNDGGLTDCFDFL